MITTFILGGVMALVVLGGNIYYDRRDKSPINWKRAFAWAWAAFALTLDKSPINWKRASAWALAAFALTLLIGWITE